MRSAEASAQQWCLVCVAYSFAHLACFPPPLEHRSVLLKTIGEVCRQQAATLLQSLLVHAHQRLLHGVTIEDVMTTLFAKQRTSVCI